MDMTILMKVMSFIVFDLLSHLRSEVGMGLLDSRSVLISLMADGGNPVKLAGLSSSSLDSYFPKDWRGKLPRKWLA